MDNDNHYWQHLKKEASVKESFSKQDTVEIQYDGVNKKLEFAIFRNSVQ